MPFDSAAYAIYADRFSCKIGRCKGQIIAVLRFAVDVPFDRVCCDIFITKSYAEYRRFEVGSDDRVCFCPRLFSYAGAEFIA